MMYNQDVSNVQPLQIYSGLYGRVAQMVRATGC